MNIRAAIDKLERREHLTREEARAVLEQLLSGSVSDAEIMALLVALRDKGEQVEELVGFAEAMRARASEGLRQAGVDVEALSRSVSLLDTCGTGGDGQGTFNVSTATALVAAAAGVRVAKHGNRSLSSRCGSADVLEALGVKIDIPLERIPECLEKVGMVFLFAPRLHLAMKNVMNARRALKTKTVSPHVLRHTTAVNLLQAGVDRAVIALILGHESVETTQIYLDADLATKERALALTAPIGTRYRRFRPRDPLLAFLQAI